ncbi:hypothetical protein LUZ63_009274 [Rhynchospora breviuscula]|uniref:Uncharacterized protein n=1 Tax=Rhynchospora breviuscula TaxID=2022672 RepID=A0A9Q0HNE8_9POAL|nr:hypothetical protein LUZ63_009274 [Rhynchospora breviuscula]
MIHPKKVIDMTKKWERIATFRRRISQAATSTCSTSTPVVNKGHIVVYTVDKMRFEIPLNYLSSRIVMELLRISEEEFGSSNDGPMVLPCDASLMRPQTMPQPSAESVQPETTPVLRHRAITVTFFFFGFVAPIFCQNSQTQFTIV